MCRELAPITNYSLGNHENLLMLRGRHKTRQMAFTCGPSLVSNPNLKRTNNCGHKYRLRRLSGRSELVTVVRNQLMGYYSCAIQNYRVILCHSLKNEVTRLTIIRLTTCLVCTVCEM